MTSPTGLVKTLPVLVICALLAFPAAAYIPPPVTIMPSIPIPKGQLSITSHPDGAAIYLGTSDTSSGTTNTVLTLIAGGYTVTLKKAGYADYAATVTVTEGSMTYLDATLTPLPTTGSLSVTSSPANAKIYVDGAYRGVTPSTSTETPGSHAVLLTLPGYLDYTEEVSITAGSTSFVTATLTPSVTAPGSIAISSTPSGANAYLDGAYGGTTPVTLSAAPGSHTVLVTLSGYNDATQAVSVTSGSATTVAITLSPAGGGKGTLAVTSTPSGARISLDGAYTGLTPLSRSVDAGTHTLRLAKTGYRDYTETVSIAAGVTTPVNVALVQEGVETTPAQAGEGSGSISVTSTPDGAYVFINNEMRGVTPLTVPGLAPGSYTVRISKEGYADHSEKVPVAGGQITTVSATLPRGTAGLPGFGSLLAVISLSLLVLSRRRG
jgi:hypothetical protein